MNTVHIFTIEHLKIKHQHDNTSTEDGIKRITRTS